MKKTEYNNISFLKEHVENKLVESVPYSNLMDGRHTHIQYKNSNDFTK